MSYIMLAVSAYFGCYSLALWIAQSALALRNGAFSYRRAHVHLWLAIVLMLGSIYINSWPKL